MSDPSPTSPTVLPPSRNIKLDGRSLREHTARGSMINAGFTAGLSLLGLVRGFVLAAFLTAEDYGVWGLLIVSLGTLLWLKKVGIGDKYIQQDEEDQELAFQKAFTLEAMFTGIFMVFLAVGIPLFALLYGAQQIILPGLVLLLVLPCGVLQTPLWIYYRNMDFVRQRSLMAIDPVVGFGVAVALAASGAGYWSFAGGVLAGGWAAAIVSVIVTPYKLRFRYDSGTMRQYWHFSWPLFVSNGSSMVIAQSAVLTLQLALGVAAVGAQTLASSISGFIQQMNGLITGTMYPAIVIVKDNLALLEESFVKSNRLALMWAMPFGCGLALFISDLIQFGLGEKWRPAAELLQITGFNGALGHIAFNWDAYMRAVGNTKAIMSASIASMVTFLFAGIPMILLFGLRGLAIAISLQTLANIVLRVYHLRRLFENFSYLRHAMRAVLPTIPAIAFVVLARLGESGDRTFLMAAIELTGYLLATVVMTWVFERALLREAGSYLLRRR